MVRTERHGSATVLTIDRPHARNALDASTLLALHDAVAQEARNPTCRMLVLTGASGVFASGGDLSELRDKTSAEDAARLSDAGYALCRAIEAAEVPVIAVLPGPALGGGAELAMACDLRIAEPGATIGFVQAKMAVTTSWGTTARLIAIVGAARATRALLLAEPMSASDALERGFVDEVVHEGAGVAKALEWLARIAPMDRGALRELKALLVAGRDVVQRELRPRERDAFVRTWTSPAHTAAVEQWFARRR